MALPDVAVASFGMPNESNDDDGQDGMKLSALGKLALMQKLGRSASTAILAINHLLPDVPSADDDEICQELHNEIDNLLGDTALVKGIRFRHREVWIHFSDMTSASIVFNNFQGRWFAKRKLEVRHGLIEDFEQLNEY